MQCIIREKQIKLTHYGETMERSVRTKENPKLSHDWPGQKQTSGSNPTMKVLNLNSLTLFASDNFWHLLITFANNLTKISMRGSRKFCQRGSNLDNVFFLFLFFLMRGDERIQIPQL